MEKEGLVLGVLVRGPQGGDRDDSLHIDLSLQDTLQVQYLITSPYSVFIVIYLSLYVYYIQSHYSHIGALY